MILRTHSNIIKLTEELIQEDENCIEKVNTIHTKAQLNKEKLKKKKKLILHATIINYGDFNS